MTNKEAKATLSVFQEEILNNLWISMEQRKGLAEALNLAIKALEGHKGKFECRMKIKDVISMLLEFDMNEKATIHTTDEYCENNIVISITDKRYEEGGAE